ncbi:MAG: rhomboid family intramembrane serine protease [Bdellovibrionales bacterium CG10_big_fil_rev_8_21_14_0_10_45_34]|nr:MAG: rhomboid family intramembrane serine protease [Bdellovibrionales bacterium CG10_big_fil_rev_8_21_14_0_10_45_34]
MGFRGSMGGTPASIPFTPMVKRLVIINVAIWLICQVILEQFVLDKPFITLNFGLVPVFVLEKFYIWQIVTYMFLHSLNPMHILFNMLMLWWMGSELETRWGSKFFLLYYFVCGIGAGVIYSIIALAVVLLGGGASALIVPVIGASGALFGLLLAYGVLFGERIVYFMFVFPMRAKYFVIILGAVELLFLINNGVGNSGVANLAHLGGLVTGYLFMIFWTRWQRKRRVKSGASKSAGHLELIVNNERKNNNGSRDPRFWN